MQYVIEDEYIIDLDVQLRRLPEVDMEIVLPVITLSNEEIPVVTPLQVLDYGTSSIEVSFTATTESAEEVVKGVLGGTENPPTFDNADYRLLHGEGNMDLAFAGLHQNTEYYLRPYALSNLGYKYGDIVAQRTKEISYVTDNLVFYLDCKDYQGGNTITEKINGLVFSGVNIASSVNGLVFSSGNYISGGVGFTLPQLNNCTIECCYNCNSLELDGYMLFQPNDTSKCYLYNHRTAENKAFIYMGRPNPVYIAYTYINGTVSMSQQRGAYNGISIPITTSGSYTNSGFTDYIRIGSRGDGSWQFRGTVYAIRIYNKILTEEEIQQNYQYDKYAYNID